MSSSVNTTTPITTRKTTPPCNIVHNNPSSLNNKPRSSPRAIRSYLKQYDSNEDNYSLTSYSYSSQTTPYHSIIQNGHQDEHIVTPFAQILNSLKNVRQNFLNMSNIPHDKIGKNSIHSINENNQSNILFALNQSISVDDSNKIQNSLEILEELDWCLSQLENMQSHKTISEIASSKFKRLLNKELSNFAEQNKSDNQIAEFICNTYLDKKEEMELPAVKIIDNSDNISASKLFLINSNQTTQLDKVLEYHLNNNNNNNNSDQENNIMTEEEDLKNLHKINKKYSVLNSNNFNNLQRNSNDSNDDKKDNNNNKRSSNNQLNTIISTPPISTIPIITTTTPVDTTNNQLTTSNSSNSIASTSKMNTIFILGADSTKVFENNKNNGNNNEDDGTISKNDFEDLPKYGIELQSTDKLDDLMDNLNSWGIDIFLIDELTLNRPLTAVCYTILDKRDLIRKMSINPCTLINFLTSLEDHYQNVPYHNKIHAADVIQSMHVLLNSNALESVFTDLEIFTAIFSAAIHDVDHPGLTNQYLINTGSELALMYNDESVLENHHLAVAFKILQNESRDIFKDVNKKQRQLIRKMAIELVLATDMSKHMSLLAELKTMVETKKVAGSGSVVLENYQDKITVLQNMLHCADLGNPTKPLEIYQRWLDRVMNEFFLQGDRESSEGLEISPMCDRHKASIEKSQVGFIDFVVHPLWESWSDLVAPDAQDILDNLERNRNWFWDQSNINNSPNTSTTTTNNNNNNNNNNNGNNSS